MCELLVKAVDANHPDPDTDHRGCYKRGDIVVVMPDGHQWGAGELDTNVFEVVKFPGMSVDDYLRMEQLEDLPNSAAMKIPALKRHIQEQPRNTAKRRRFAVDLNTQTILDKVKDNAA